MLRHSSHTRKRIRLAGLILSCVAVLMAQTTLPTNQLRSRIGRLAMLARIETLEKRMLHLKAKRRRSRRSPRHCHRHSAAANTQQEDVTKRGILACLEPN